ncbi:MAG: NADH-quinone oxidoreductase subunit M [Geodermatophilaceae bacterium]|nr:NADH-quinone oxidoreductase subunit M [Geodermatophilaceae bacterium]
MPFLTAITWLPIVGVAVIMLLPRGQARLAKAVALAAAGGSLVLSWGLLISFDRSSSEPQFTERTTWIPELGMTYSLGVDGLSFPMILLTTLLSVVALIASLKVDRNIKAYFAWMLLLEFAILGVFVARDWFLFYVFWEIALVPMFFLIGMWGGPKKERATLTFFLYTLGGSIFMLLGIFAVYLATDPHTFDMAAIEAASGEWTRGFQIAPFLAFFVGFAVKIPVFPLHGWLPLAHVQAPTPVSIMLSGVLLKLGAYGILRVADALPLGLQAFLPWLFALALINILYGAFLAFRQTDLKAIVAFSSISHMGFVLLGIAALNVTGVSGAVFMMLAHGIITGGLFLLVGIIYERTHTMDIGQLSGLSGQVPVYAGITVLALLASMGLPGLAQFVGEFQTLIGAFERWGLFVLFASLGILVTATFTLRVIAGMFTGELDERWKGVPDLGGRELAAAVPLALLTVVLGIFPSFALGLTDATVRAMTAITG